MKQAMQRNRFWQDKDGNNTLLQPANVPLTIWLITYLAGWLFREGLIARLLEVVGFGALFTWAFLEITAGDSYFRRLLGVVVMILIVANRV